MTKDVLASRIEVLRDIVRDGFGDSPGQVFSNRSDAIR
jgi:hypothetical protein